VLKPTRSPASPSPLVAMGCSNSKTTATATSAPQQRSASSSSPSAAQPAQQQAAGSPVLLSEEGGKQQGAGGVSDDAAALANGDDCNIESETISEEQWRQKVARPTGASDAPPVHVRALTCNLAAVPADESGSSAFASMPDFVGFQECRDLSKVLIDLNLKGKYTAIQGPHSLAMAFASADWESLGSGAADVAVDEAEQFKEARGVQWVRLSHKKTGKVVFFMNHHGPLRVNSGGRAGSPATAGSIVKTAFRKVEAEDAVILVGDFNAQPGSQTVRELERFMPRVAPLAEYDGLEHIFSPLQLVASERLASGSALAARFAV